jgi:hypothetical protein
MAVNRPPWFTSTALKPISKCRQMLKQAGNLSKDRGVAQFGSSVGMSAEISSLSCNRFSYLAKFVVLVE